MESIFEDLRHSVRNLIRTPIFSSTAVLSLALGIGASTALFSAAYTLFLRPLPVKDPGSLVTFSVSDETGRIRQFVPLAFADQLQLSGAFSHVIATQTGNLNFIYEGRAERIICEVVTPNFFTGLGLSPALGQGFTPDVIAGNWAPEAVLSYSFWKARFGGDPGIIGRVIQLNTYAFTVVGVSPATFFDLHQGRDPDLRIPFVPPGREIHQIDMLGANQDVPIIARLAPHVSRAQAQTVADARLHEFARTSSESRYRERTFGPLRLLSGKRGWPELAQNYEDPVTILLVLTLMAFLVACANVANMTIARAASRRHELAIRSCLGAGRIRLIRHIVLESFVLCCGGGLAGLVVARWLAQFVVHFLPQGPSRLVLQLPLDAYSIAFTFLLCTAATLLVGLTTATQSTREGFAAALKVDSNASVGGSSKLRKALVVVQIASSLVLLAIAGLFIRTVVNLYPKSDYPQARSVLLFTIDTPQEIYSPDRIRSIVTDLTQRVSSIPGVKAAGMAENGPFAGRANRDILQVSGRSAIEVASDFVTPGFLNAIGLPVLSGRDFSASDKPGSPKVVILSQSAAKSLFPHEDAVGRSVHLPSARGTNLYPLNGIPVFQVIGIVPDAHYYDVRDLMPTAFFAFQADPPYLPTLHVRVSAGDPVVFIPAIRREVDAVDTGLPVFNVRALEERVQDAVARERMIADLSSAVGGLALALAAVGLYGVLAYSVSRRSREIGVRIALGSTTRDILWLVWSEGFMLIGSGVVVGSSFAVVAGSLLANRLYGIGPTDPATLVSATAILLLVSVVATSIPAAHASGVDPVSALRSN